MEAWLFVVLGLKTFLFCEGYDINVTDAENSTRSSTTLHRQHAIVRRQAQGFLCGEGDGGTFLGEPLDETFFSNAIIKAGAWSFPKT